MKIQLNFAVIVLFAALAFVSCNGKSGSKGGGGANSPWGTADLIDDESNTNNPAKPQIAMDDSGNGVAVWEQYDAAYHMSIYATCFSASTGMWSTATAIETDTQWAQEPKIAVNASGNAVVVWEQHDGVSAYHIWANYYSALTSTWGTAILIESGAAMSNGYQVAIDPAGKAVAVWHQPSNGTDSIWSNHCNSSGVWGTAVLLETQDISVALTPQIALDPSGNGVAVWQQFDKTLWSNRYTAATTSWGTAKLIMPVTANMPMAPMAAIDASGNAAVVWIQSSASKDSVWASHCTVSGVWDTAVLLETADTGAVYSPQIGMDSSGNAVVVWTQYDGTNFNAWSNSYTALTSSWGTAGLLESVIGESWSVRVAVNASGNAVAVWQKRDGTRYDVWSNRFTASTSSWGTAEMIESNNTGDSYAPQFAINTSGDGIAVWIQNVLDTGKDNIYASIYTAP